MSQQEFCRRVAELDAQSAARDESEPQLRPEDLDALRDLAARAPTEELRGALETLVPVYERLAEPGLGPDEVMSIAMELMTEERNLEAFATLEDYTTEVCGLAPISDADDPVDISGPDSVVTGDGQLDATQLREALAEATDFYAPGNTGSSVLVTPSSEPGVTLVELDVSEPESLDALGLCAAVAAEVFVQAPDVSAEVVIRRDGVVVASREPDGECTEQ